MNNTSRSIKIAIAKKFWSDAFSSIQFPIELSRLEHGILLNYPISLVKLNKLTLNTVASYLKNRSIDIPSQEDNLDLFGFIISHGTHTYIFINGTESVEEQCFTLAHEFAHYLLDYRIPRQTLINFFGPGICDALDNKRPFNAEERVSALIKGYSLKPFVHLLDMPVATAIMRQNIWQSEATADQLALELIAPFDSLMKDIAFNKIPKNYSSLIKFLSPHLKLKYNLPNSIADFYGKELANKISGGISLKEKWKI